MNDYDPLMQQIAADEAASRERVRQVIYAEGPP